MSENRDTVNGRQEKMKFTPRVSRFYVPFNIKPDHFSPLPFPAPAGTTSMETLSSSSTPMATATDDTEGSGKGTAKPSGEGTVVSPFKKPKDTIATPGRDETRHDDVISESKSKSGDSFKKDSQGLQDTDDIDEMDPTQLFHISTQVGKFHRGIYLFETQLTPSDIELGRLTIPVERALSYFPPLVNPKAYEEKIEITDTQKDDWYMPLTHDRVECAFVISNGWQGFVDWHNLEARDVIRFYRPVPRVHSKHFLIEFVKGDEAEADDNFPEFRQENFLFQLQLSPSDVGYGRLIIPKEDVQTHFPAVKIPASTHKLERLNFTDTQNRDWCMRIVFSSQVDGYMLINGWERFVKKHNLEAMDVVKFYKPVQPLHGWHFLIDYVKGEKAGANATQLGRSKNEGNGGDGRTGGDNKQGDRGGPSQDGRSHSKGKMICCWAWKKQCGGRDRAVMITLEEILEMTVSTWEEMTFIK